MLFVSGLQIKLTEVVLKSMQQQSIAWHDNFQAISYKPLLHALAVQRLFAGFMAQCYILASWSLFRVQHTLSSICFEYDGQGSIPDAILLLEVSRAISFAV